MNHYGDSNWRRHNSPIRSDGGIDEPGKKVDVMILIGMNKVSRSSDTEEAQWEAILERLFTTLWQKFQCAVLIVCTIPMSTRTLSSDAIIWKKTQQKSRQMEKRRAISGKSQRWTNDLDRLRA